MARIKMIIFYQKSTKHKYHIHDITLQKQTGIQTIQSKKWLKARVSETHGYHNWKTVES